MYVCARSWFPLASLLCSFPDRRLLPPFSFPNIPRLQPHRTRKECYYSQSTPGSSLARHMDERHEETKGPRGWSLPSRRSLSWLVYASEPDEADPAKEWDARTHGGLLRTFPQRRYRSDVRGGDDAVPCGSHEGDLQVGWLLAENDDSEEDDAGRDGRSSITHPVFLDAWFERADLPSGAAGPLCVLYVVRRTASKRSEGDDATAAEHVTAPWSAEAIQGSVAEFLRHRARIESDPSRSSPSLFLRPTYARRFRSLEDRESWARGEIPDGAVVEEFAPAPGTLVAFDSVSVSDPVFFADASSSSRVGRAFADGALSFSIVSPSLSNSHAKTAAARGDARVEGKEGGVGRMVSRRDSAVRGSQWWGRRRDRRLRQHR